MVIKGKNKERIVAALEGKTRVNILYEKYCEAENKLIDELNDLPNNGEECHCGNEREIYKYIFEGSDFDEIQNICLKCGGFVEARDC